MNDSTNDKNTVATFAGGCFWCMEAPYAKLPGVLTVVSGYAGGELDNPSYEDVCSGRTGHREAVQVTFDPNEISYQTLLENYWQQIDPTDAGGSFVDRGFHYTSAVFYHDEEQKVLAETSRDALAGSEIFADPIATKILPYTNFFPAEDYHQNYFKTNALRYQHYRSQSGRDDFIEENWSRMPDLFADADISVEEFGKPDKATLKAELTDLQFKVTQQDGTEPAFRNEFWDNKIDGLYVDIVSGEPLFSSVDKFDSGTGWPSFVRPISSSSVVEKSDNKIWAKRTEVRSKQADSHLGHVFPDGPAPSGLRYCINSASLRFVPLDKLAEEGYAEYLPIFE